MAGRHDSTRPPTPAPLVEVNLTTYFFSRDKMPGDFHGQAGDFPRKVCSDRRKHHGCGQKKKKKTLSPLYLASGPLRKCCELKRCADRVRSRTDYRDELELELSTMVSSQKDN